MSAPQAAPPRPLTDVILVSAQRNTKHFTERAKRAFTEFASLELSGLGSAISNVCSVAETLKREGVAEITKVNTTTTPEGNHKIIIKVEKRT